MEENFDVLPSRKDVRKRNRQAGFQDNQADALWRDDGVGAIIDKVKESCLGKNTLIVFASHHGSWRHGMTALHDCGRRVPMLLRWPGTIQPGSQHDGQVAKIGEFKN